MYDACGIGLINMLQLNAVWFMFMAGLGILMHASLFISVAITAVALGIASPIVVAGVTAGSMQRSGGDCVYDSRIIHRIAGMAVLKLGVAGLSGRDSSHRPLMEASDGLH